MENKLHVFVLAWLSVSVLSAVLIQLFGAGGLFVAWMAFAFTGAYCASEKRGMTMSILFTGPLDVIVALCLGLVPIALIAVVSMITGSPMAGWLTSILVMPFVSKYFG